MTLTVQKPKPKTHNHITLIPAINQKPSTYNPKPITA